MRQKRQSIRAPNAATPQGLDASGVGLWAKRAFLACYGLDGTMRGEVILVITLAVAAILVAPALIITTASGGVAPGLARASASANASAPGAWFAQADGLWDDPQNAPHPAYNWPTLTHPPVGGDAPPWWQTVPAAELPETIEGVALQKRAQSVPSGAGIAVFGRLAIVPGFSTDTSLVDLSNPELPTLLSTIAGRHRGAVAIPDATTGRLTAVFATASTLEAWDITDPREPDFLSSVAPLGGSHKVGVVPGTPIVYNANSDGSGARISIYDYSDPADPQKVQDFASGYGCHHIYFWVTLAKQRAICAGVEATQLFDIADPAHPEVVLTVPVHHGQQGLPSTGVVPVTFSHFAILSRDGNTLIVGDETGGGIAPACDAHAEAAGKSVSGAAGNLYFYDIRGEDHATLQGWFNPGAHYTSQLRLPGSCTAHHGRLMPDPAGERDLMVMGFYNGGVVVIDFSDRANPLLVDQWTGNGANVWEAWYVNGWVVTGDLNRGLDVLRFT